MADDVTIQIGGNAAGAVSAANQTSSAVTQLGSAAHTAGGHMDLLKTVLGPLGGALEQVAGRARMVLETMILWRSIDFIKNQIEGWTSALFELNNTMEKTQTGWQFLFGTGDNAASRSMAADLANWTKTQSYFYPFTRQDILGSINAAGMATQDPNLIKQYLPDIADVASVRTNFAGQPVTLQQAMYALSMANEGMSRMLKYDLKITPEDLKKFGWNEGSGDFANLLEALKKYNVAHHLTGASKYVATHTFFGEWSSFEDRIQNMQLLIGQHMFTALKDDLGNFTEWWDQHQKQLDAIGEWMGLKIGNGVKNLSLFARDFALGAFNGSGGGLGGALGGVAGGGGRDVLALIQGLLSSGPVGSGTFITPLKELAQALNAPGAHIFFTDLGTVLGVIQNTVVTTGLTLLESVFTQIGQSGVGDALIGLVVALQNLLMVLQPVIGPLATLLGQIVGLGIGNALTMLANLLHAVAQGANDFMRTGFGQWLQQQLVQAFKDLKAAFTDLQHSFTPQEWQLLITLVKALGAALILLPLAAIILAVETLAGLIELLAKGIQVLTGLLGKVQEGLSWVNTKMRDLGNTIQGKIISLVLQASQWGFDLIKNLADGMSKGLAYLEAVLGIIGKEITGQLGHSVPSKGPLKDELTWMPHMMDNLAMTMLASAPRLYRATQQVAGTMAGIMGGTSISTAYGNISQNYYGATPLTMQRIATQTLQQYNRATVLANNTPGAFTRFGYRGR